VTTDPYGKLPWLLTAPRGENLPITCEYPFSRGKSTPDARDIPDYWAQQWLPSDDPDGEATAAGFVFAAAYVVEENGKRYLTNNPAESQGDALAYCYLRNADGVLVATWDEGRWWTPEESAAFRLMLQVPDTYVVAEGFRQQSLPRRERRRRRKGES